MTLVLNVGAHSYTAGMRVRTRRADVKDIMRAYVDPNLRLSQCP